MCVEYAGLSCVSPFIIFTLHRCIDYRTSKRLSTIFVNCALVVSTYNGMYYRLPGFLIRGSIDICGKYLVHTPPRLRDVTLEGGKGRYLRHIILHYVPKRRTNAVLIYASPRADKKKEMRERKKERERGGRYVGISFFPLTTSVSRRISPETTRTIQSETRRMIR